MSALSHRRPIVLPRRKTPLGIFCAGLVLLLGLLASNPIAHEQLCHHDSSSQDFEHGCAVELFALGVEPDLTPEIPTAPDYWEARLVLALGERSLEAPDLRLPFACGPPRA